jgi:group I intron endonuclease
MTRGIYCITCTATGDRYVGRSIQIEQRWKTHLSQLRSSCHKNRLFSQAWENYGESAFKFEVLESCEKSTTFIQLEALERKWITSINATYNIDPFRDERNNYMSELMKNRWREKSKQQ